MNCDLYKYFLVGEGGLDSVLYTCEKDTAVSFAVSDSESR